MATSPLTSQVLASNNIEARDVNVNSTTVHHTVNNHSVLPQHNFKQILEQHVAIGALYDSKERFDPPKCHPQTRTAILDRIEQWAADDSLGAKPILWLSGPAGAGKSAIAHTLVERWKTKGISAVAFFFWGTAAQRNQKTRLVPTIALQLLELFPTISSGIEEAVTIIKFFERSLTFQLDRLVVEPLHAIAKGEDPVVIVIDGLDECCADLPPEGDFLGQDHESQQREILEVLSVACSKLPWVRFLIVSRPERQIRETFGKGSLEEQTLPLSLKDALNAEADIQLYLNCKFEEIRRQNGIGASWPTKSQVEKLVRKSSGQFIYPSVVIKHISRARANPMQSLQDVLELQPGSVDKPLAELDMLYTLVLKSVSTQSRPVVADILGYMVADVKPNDWRYVRDIFIQRPTGNSPQMFERFLFLPQGGVNFHLTDLHSVLDIPTDPQHAISFIHATFSEYLEDQSRSGDFFVSNEHTCIRFAQLSIRHLQALDSQTTSIDDHNELDLFACPCAWINHGCPPSKQLALYSWSLMSTEIGRCPFAASHNTTNSSLASKELSTQFISIMKGSYANGRPKLVKYLQRCNIPEIEPSWWRRLLVRRNLKDALLRMEKTRQGRT